ncbi:MAG: stage III sporulation protein AF [Clostridia bacterium]|nr:stage III sporulation protein AF [Clostridia bacterium]
MKGWILSVVGMVLTVTLAEIMLPEGQTSKYVKGVVSLMVVYVMILPIPKLLSLKFDANSFFNFSASSYEIDSGFIQIIKEDKQSALSDSLTSVFRDSGIASASATVLIQGENEIDRVILSAKEEDVESAFAITLSYLNVKEDRVVIHEIDT